jgi:hypothetical protein
MSSFLDLLEILSFDFSFSPLKKSWETFIDKTEYKGNRILAFLGFVILISFYFALLFIVGYAINNHLKE